ncbi:hypothetical protein XENTR_v10015545 [Xenopus tropicalis]|uniref:Uncharacterized LOC100497073 n=1 Tax=Xenopus tropicalis TaxID=8364 RepID=A0A803JVT5_XENTR|nr:uncharacterized protein LOC100497073 [Xenopus tropicalis]KAE8595131.1 hypothetical protein XENTR_v10015545 [Xenopus tropicalis]|eukprot:XP_002940885.2 PREDICTED: uncharacterized protein LOC100497073 [Xenopus tropicalis]
MPTCIVKGCSNSCSKKQFPHVVLHAFPGNLTQIRNWLEHIPQNLQNFRDIDEMALRVLKGKKSDTFRVCSEHFTVDSYTEQGKKRRILKREAVPTQFPETFSPPLKKPKTQRVSKKHKDLDSTLLQVAPNHSQVVIQQLPCVCSRISVAKKPILVDASTYTTCYFEKKSASTNTGTKFAKRTVASQTVFNQKNKRLQCNFMPGQYPVTSQTVATPLERPPPWAAPQVHWATPSLKNSYNGPALDMGSTCLRMREEAESDSVATKGVDMRVGATEHTDPTNEPLVQNTYNAKVADDECEVESTVDSENLTDLGYKDEVDENKFLVFESCLDKLLWGSRCRGGRNCPAAIKSIRKKITGSFLSVNAVCTKGHSFHLWDSQPKKGHMPIGDVLMSAAIVLSGSSYSKVSYMNKILGLRQIGKETHYRHQRLFLFPTINHHWESEQHRVMKELGQKPVCLVTDRNCHSAEKRCVCTFMEATSKKIVSLKVNQASPETSSLALERQTFQSALDNVLQCNVNVQLVCTEPRPWVKNLMEENYGHILHEFDAWRYGKSVGNRVAAASKKRNCSELSQWGAPVRNHLWWAVRSCEGNTELMMEKWNSLIYHIIGVHKWRTGALFHTCEHAPQEDEVTRSFLVKGSRAHRKLREIVLSRDINKNLPKLRNICHMGELDVFRSNALKYRPKQSHFSAHSLIARTQLAALDHNRNVHHQLAILANGRDEEVLREDYPRVEFRELKKDWRVKPVYDLARCDFIFTIMKDVVRYVYGERCPG